MVSRFIARRLSCCKAFALPPYAHLYNCLADFLADLDPARTLTFHAPEEIQDRVEALLEKKQETGLSEKETEELEHYFILEHILRRPLSPEPDFSFLKDRHEQVYFCGHLESVYNT